MGGMGLPGSWVHRSAPDCVCGRGCCGWRAAVGCAGSVAPCFPLVYEAGWHHKL